MAINQEKAGGRLPLEGVTSAHDVFELVYAVRARIDPRECLFVCGPDMRQTLRAMHDEDGRYYWDTWGDGAHRFAGWPVRVERHADGLYFGVPPERADRYLPMPTACKPPG